MKSPILVPRLGCESFAFRLRGVDGFFTTERSDRILVLRSFRRSGITLGSDVFLLRAQHIKRSATAVNNMIDWALKKGFIFSPQKTVCMHFCRRRGLHPDPEFQLNGSPIPIVQETKFLGIVFDTKLTFRSHIKHLKTKCIRTLNIMKVLSNTSWGADSGGLGLKIVVARSQ
ncbi:hypothetical protein AVEN_148250-1 [Araneus ventricosus]|uniref:Reverse transcriptase domain-containing protein n=1 Tax=Araneus ventricosus TaxID=182803 RepID=A0A4Y2X3C7_ARAVE|nr:hypothetical protein AVEN_214219-1 [Araneus ventricosus]GBO43292.1 hypothetical protein AVEN_98171-1 [Araneus ventricosus]GBO43294.1 hypothetical protein AVEN_251189-1 [Araneus ventricosus]GBO43297.1 hypothetical protein AVEN_148250-1 [Araneus ventricosus]